MWTSDLRWGSLRQFHAACVRDGVESPDDWIGSGIVIDTTDHADNDLVFTDDDGVPYKGPLSADLVLEPVERPRRGQR